MTDSVTVYFFFDDPLTEETVQAVLSCCHGQCAPIDADAVGEAGQIASVDNFGEFMYEDSAFSLATQNGSDAIPDQPTLVLALDELYFRPRDGLNTTEDVRAHSAHLVELVRLLYERHVETGHEPLYVAGLGPGDEEVLSTPSFEEQLTVAGLHGTHLEFVSWLQILPSRMFETYAVVTLQSAPVSHVEMLSTGAILFVVDTSPTMVESVYEPEAVETYLHG